MEELHAPVVVDLPLRGEWTVLRTPADRVPSHGTDALGQRYAYDFAVTDDRPGAPVHPAGLVRWLVVGGRTRDCHGWGEPVHAALAGTVVTVVDGVPERRWVHPVREAVIGMWTAWRTRGGRRVDDPARLAGNHVIVRSEGVVAVYAHLVPGSVCVSPGHRVERGEVLGRVGHSGTSTSPHLHFQLMDDVDPHRARGVPAAFARYAVRRDGRWEDVRDGVPGRMERVRWSAVG